MMEISDHAKEQLQKRFKISNPSQLEKKISESKLMSQTDVNKCGTQYRSGFVYLRYEDMMMVFKGDTLITVLWIHNPFLKLKRKLLNHNETAIKDIFQRCQQLG